MKTNVPITEKPAIAISGGYVPLNTIHLSDNIEFLKTLPDNSVDTIITDSPYGLGKEPNAIKCLQDWIDHGYHDVKGKGFMGKTWDAFVPQPILWKECYRVLKPGGHLLSFFGTRTYDWGTLAIRLAGFEIRDCIQWIYGSGFPKANSHLKPANEPICVARKPGANRDLNIDDARIDTDWDNDPNLRVNGKKPSQTLHVYGKDTRTEHWHQTKGRYPSNVMLDDIAAKIMDEQSGVSGGDKRKVKIAKQPPGQNGIYGTFNGTDQTPCYNDFGGASRFFYVAKASPSERAGNPHPTVKPLKLMQQLVKLYTPKGGVCLDPHMGSGTTLVACRDWCDYIGVDADKFSYDITNKRLFATTNLFG